MKKLNYVLLSVATTGALVAGGLFMNKAQAAPWKIDVQVNKPGATINPNFYGLMTEEINHAYDGGLYAELIQNRSFKDDATSPVHWSLVMDGGVGAISLDKSGGVNPALDTSLKMEVTQPGQRVGAANDGFWGIPVKPKTTYRANFYAKSTGNNPLTVSIESKDGTTTYAQAKVAKTGAGWQKYTVQLKTSDVKPSLNNRFVISTSKAGTVWLSWVSLFPPTYKNRPNGNRIDLMEKMAAMNPKFLRFPGGNYVDPGHYEWKITLGPVDQRTGHPGAWSYRSSDGIGILEFLEWCEDLRMEPVLAVTDGRGWLPAEGDVAPLVQDALDEIEYVTGDTTTKWGAKRAADGHPKPFALRYVEVGNEDFFDPLTTYEARFAKFYDAIRAKYPQLQIIATRGDIKSRRPDIVDDHLYASVPGMLRASRNYDKTDRNGPKIFVGEWASQDTGTPWEASTYNNVSPTPSLNAALGDAAYLTGLERNADIVTMACYAPLLVNVNPGARQWAQNLIGYDALTSYGSPSYYMQVMFNNNVGDVVLPISVETSEDANIAPPAPHGGIGVATWATQAEFKDIKVMQGDTELYHSDFANGETGWENGLGTWTTRDGVLVQSGDDHFAVATTGNPSWTDYTYTLKARKTGGAEGFLIPFHVADSNNRWVWNLGGWNNTRSSLQHMVDGETTEITPSAPVTIETGRWYDIRIEVQGRSVRAYLDDKLISVATDDPLPATAPIYASASRDKESGDIILKVVNVAASAQPIQLNLQGATGVQAKATGQVIMGNPTDVNTIEQPEKVVPKNLSITNVAPTFTHEFPAHSVSVIRIKASK